MRCLLSVLFLSACVTGCGSSSTTTSPSPTPSTPAPAAATYTLTGTVTDQQTGRGIQSAAVQISDGPNANKAAVTGTDGSYSLPGLAGGDVTLRVAATGYSAVTQAMTLTGNKRFDASLQSLTRTITGTVTDATSGGILPRIFITVVGGPTAGLSTQTDGNGNYTLAGVSSDPMALSASATSYITLARSVAAGGNAVQNFVLARAGSSTPTIPPPATPPTPVPAGSTVIGFSRLGALPYSESGYTIVSTLASWFSSGYGNPGPSLQFSTPAGITTEGEVKVTAGGSTFRFSSVDLYSSTTQIPYVMTGIANSTVLFAVSGRQGNTFGNLATVANSQSSTPIDTLLIHLSNPAATCCGNPMGIDNIVVR